MDSFVTSFTFKIDVTNGNAFGDGLVWVVTNDPRNTPAAQAAVGSTGGGLGFIGVVNSVGFRFDTYNGGPANTAGVIYGASVATYTDGGEFNTQGILNWPDGNTFLATVYYTLATTNLTVVVSELVSGGNTRTFTNLTVNIAKQVGCTAGVQGCTAYMGFTAGSGGNWERHLLTSWSCE